MASTLTSSSTLAEAKAAYFDNASYYEDASTSKALAFITACRFLLLWIPKHAARHGGEELDFDPEVLRSEQAEARQWLSQQSSVGGTGRTKFVGFAGDFRR